MYWQVLPRAEMSFLFYFILFYSFYLTDGCWLFLVFTAIRCAILVSIPGMTADQEWPIYTYTVLFLPLISTLSFYHSLYHPTYYLFSLFYSLYLFSTLFSTVFLLNQPHGTPPSNHSPAFPETHLPYHCTIPNRVILLTTTATLLLLRTEYCYSRYGWMDGECYNIFIFNHPLYGVQSTSTHFAQLHPPGSHPPSTESPSRH